MFPTDEHAAAPYDDLLFLVEDLLATRFTRADWTSTDTTLDRAHDLLTGDDLPGLADLVSSWELHGPHRMVVAGTGTVGTENPQDAGIPMPAGTRERWNRLVHALAPEHPALKEQSRTPGDERP